MGGKTTDYAISELEYHALPPVLRRKFFSSLERLRLENDGGAPCWPSTSSSSCGRRPSSVSAKAASVLTEVFALSPSTLRQRSRLHKRGIGQPRADRLRDHDRAAWFAALPPAVRRKQFSREEQIIFAGARPRVLPDLALEVVKRRSPNRHRRLSSLCRCQPNEDHFYFCFDPSESATEDGFDASEGPDDDRSISSSHSGISTFYARYLDSVDNLDELDRIDIETVAWSVDSMADYSIENFCFLEPEPELDLRLDDYHQAIQETAAGTSQTPIPARRSFARNLSLSSRSLRQSSLSSQTMALSNPSQTSSMQPNGPQSPTSMQPVRPLHRARPSSGSIDRQAKFYQDPAARMQLRLYLASPSRFDEAVEFGFPALQDAGAETRLSSPVQSEAAGRAPSANEETKGNAVLRTDTPSLVQDEDEDTEGESTDEHDRWNDPITPQSSEFKQRDRPSKVSKGRIVAQPYAQWRSLEGREMTMHMTLTRPELRSPDETDPVRTVNCQPLERPVLVPYDLGASIWEPQTHELSRVRKMWNRLRAR